MAVFGKLIGDELHFAPKILNNDGKQYINPPEELYLQLGYLPIEYTNAPESRNGYHVFFSWLVIGNQIRQTWHYEADTQTMLIEKINKLESKLSSAPILYVAGMEIEEGQMYTDGKINVMAIANGTPTSFNDSNFFD